MPRQEIIQNEVGAKIVQGKSIRFVKLIYFRDTIKKLSLNTLEMDKKRFAPQLLPWDESDKWGLL